MFVQLLKTTPYLSGQHKIDVCLRKAEEHDDASYAHSPNEWLITTGDCHLSPLSDSLTYTDSIERPFFSQTYGDNLRRLYENLKDDFFRDVPTIKANNILYEEDDKWIDTTDHTYECGLKRIRYERYHKQFSWLCPLWVENASDLKDVYFIMTIYGDTAERHSMKLRITPSKRLISSLMEWLDGVSSDLLYIDVDKERATITGAFAESGTPVTLDVSYIVPQLISRERPILETNSVLNQLFSSNHIIARQLVNLNFCFSPEDIIPSHVINEMTGKRWKITIDTYHNNEQIDKVDFLSNYEFLPGYVRNGDEGHYDFGVNVFDYFNDDKYIDYMYIDKTTQPDPYWSLVENPEYLYNFYNGFSTWYAYLDPATQLPAKEQIMGLSQNQPDVAHIEYDYRYSNLGWCEIYDFSGIDAHSNGTVNFDNIRPMIVQAYNNSKRATQIKFSKGKVCWANGLKYDLTYADTAPEGNFKLFMCLVSDTTGNSGIYVEPIEDALCIFVPCGSDINHPDNTLKNRLTVKAIIKDPPILQHLPGPERAHACQKVQAFLDFVMKRLVWPIKIEFTKSIYPITCESPSKDTKEVTYIKQEYNVRSYIYRYSGALRPFFVAPDHQFYYNIDYNFKKWKNSDFNSTDSLLALKEYNDKLNSGYAPVYPSINYYAIEGGKTRRVDYFTYPERYDNVDFEFPWYEDGRLYILPHQIDIEFLSATTTNLKEADFRIRLVNALHDRYGIPHHISQKQLALLYDYTADYDYASDIDIDNQRFKVKYTLR